MITASIFQSVEFYVVATVLAAAVLALCVRPSGRGEAQTRFATAELTYAGGEGEPSIDISVRDDGAVVLTRRGLSGLTSASRVSLAITQIQFDIAIEERVADVPGGEPVDTAVFVLDFMGPERYHLSYNVEHTSLFTSATVAVRPGVRIHRELTL